MQLIQGHSQLGKRDIDRDFDWHHNYTTVEDLRHRESYLESKKRLAIIHEDIPDVDIANLVDNQRRIFLRVGTHEWNNGSDLYLAKSFNCFLTL